MTWLELARAHADFLIPALLIAGAALCVVAPNGRTAWGVALLAALSAAVLSCDLARRGLFASDLAPAADGIAIYVAPILAICTLLILFAAGALALRESDKKLRPLEFALLLTHSGGWLGALFAHDFVSLFLAVETAWLAGAGLVAFVAGRERAALNGAFRMLIAGAVMAGLMLIGIGLVGRGLGVLDIVALANVPVATPNLVALGIGCIILALALKAGAAPLHLWTGAAFTRSAGGAALALGAVGAVGAIGVLLRVAASAQAAPAISAAIAAGLAALGAASVIIGSLQAIGAKSLMRLGAYAIAAQAGCALIGAALGSTAGFAAALLQLTAMAAAALALFGAAAALSAAPTLNALDGLGRRAPLAGAAITIGALSLMGAPLTIGFLSRWRLMEAAVHGGWQWASAAAVLTSLAGVFYGGQLIVRIYFRRASAPTQLAGGLTHWMLAPALAAAMIVILWGINPALLLVMSEQGALWRPGQFP